MFLWKGSDYHGQKSKTSIKEKREGWCKEASEAYIRIALYTGTPAYVGWTWQVFFCFHVFVRSCLACRLLCIQARCWIDVMYLVVDSYIYK